MNLNQHKLPGSEDDVETTLECGTSVYTETWITDSGEDDEDLLVEHTFE